MKLKGWIAALVLFLALILAVGALADSARVVTPGGAVKMRRSADDRARLVVNVPNYSLVEIIEEGEEWTEVRYRNRTGFIKNVFLRLPSALPGMTVYPDEGTLILRMGPAADAQPVTAVSAAETVTVRSIGDGWAWVRADGAILNGTEGYVPLESLSWQRQEPGEGAGWIPEPGTISVASPLRMGPEEDAPILTQTTPGDEVTVMAFTDSVCLALVNGRVGYLPTADVCLSGVQEGGTDAGTLTSSDADAKAIAALRRRFRRFAGEDLYMVASASDGVWHCGYYDDSGQYRYTALVDAETGEVLFTAAYTAFAGPTRSRGLLAHGETRLLISADTLAVGDVLDIEVYAWTDHNCAYQVSLNGVVVAECAESAHFSASYRPREAGDYQLRVTVTDADGLRRTETAAFTVDAELAPQAGSGLYSQKDGSWDGVAYHDRDLQQSGSAVFALAHALHRMGLTGENTEPAELACAYGLCLTLTGTNNERLIRTAGQDFGFTTRAALIGDRVEIARRLQAGELFSFAIVRGHIALIDGISEDGTMVHILDSAPSATFERINGAALYTLGRSGAFSAALTLDGIPGARWYLETGEYGALAYWLPLSYVANRGVRVIQPAEPVPPVDTSFPAPEEQPPAEVTTEAIILDEDDVPAVEEAPADEPAPEEIPEEEETPEEETPEETPEEETPEETPEEETPEETTEEEAPADDAIFAGEALPMFGWELLPDGTAMITGLDGDAAEIAVPDEIMGHRVTVIGEGAFCDRADLTSVVIPEGVTELGAGAFQGCAALASVDLPESLAAIGAYAFDGCEALTALALPDGLEEIGFRAFHGCDSLALTVARGSAAEASCEANGLPYAYAD